MMNEYTEYPVIRFSPKKHADLITMFFFFFLPSSCAGEDLLSFVSAGPLDEPTAARFTRQIAEGLCYLHESGLIHTNISVSVTAALQSSVNS